MKPLYVCTSVLATVLLGLTACSAQGVDDADKSAESSAPASTKPVATSASATTKSTAASSAASAKSTSNACLDALAGKGANAAPQPAPSSIPAPTIDGKAAPASSDIKAPALTPKMCQHDAEGAEATAVNYVDLVNYAAGTWDYALPQFLVAPEGQALFGQLRGQSENIQYMLVNNPPVENLTSKKLEEDTLLVTWNVSGMDLTQVSLGSSTLNESRYAKVLNIVTMRWLDDRWQVSDVSTQATPE